MRDFNINLLNEDVHAQTQNFMNILSSYCLYPSISKPTRITANSATLIIFLQIQSHIKHQHTCQHLKCKNLDIWKLTGHNGSVSDEGRGAYKSLESQSPEAGLFWLFLKPRKCYFHT